jgi:2-desacetyl-2-hydroxyethyl bacteriochlorophyllide A dehydrogenase
MGTLIVLERPGSIGLEEYADRALQARDVRVRTLFSGISAGTELTAYHGSNVYLHKQWDQGQRLFVPGEAPTKQYPVRDLGYEESGEVIEVGREVSRVKAGDIVCGTWGHRTQHIAAEEYAAGRLLPAGLDPILGIYSHMAAIALNGILDAGIRLGETVAVFGLGVPGQIVAQMAKCSGARVIGVDLISARLSKAVDLAAVDLPLDARAGRIAEQIKALTDNRGADVCIEASGAYPALHEAVRAAAYAARVVALGFFQGPGLGLDLGEEFHHNRINLICSQISGVGPELSYRWNRDRLVHTGIRLQADGMLQLGPLITHIVPWQDAAEAYRILDQEPEAALQVVLDFRR